MWAGDPGRHVIGHGRKEAELARYFKLEYGRQEVDRLLAQSNRANHSSRGRLVKRLRHFVAGRRGYGKRGTRIVDQAPTSRSPKAGASTSPTGKSPAPRELPVDCQHAEWEPLGSGGNATYFQCKACGALMVNQGGRLWSFSLDRPKAI